MSITQNEKIRQMTETTMVIGVDIASEVHWAKAFDWRGLELGKAIHKDPKTIAKLVLEGRY